jgi:hypothetical protein
MQANALSTSISRVNSMAVENEFIMKTGRFDEYFKVLPNDNLIAAKKQSPNRRAM